jgi:ABC-type dipeptide/oligopeptide/nickel transport system ATPase component
MRFIPENQGEVTGEVIYDGENLSDCSDKRMREIRGRYISMIFQDPMTALNPVVTIGNQIAEVIMLHADTVTLPDGYTTNEETVAALNAGKLSLDDLSEDFRLMLQKGKDGAYSFKSQISRVDAERKAGDMLEMVGIRRERFNDYPHQLSGGMKQRVAVARALALESDILLLDEPFGAIDPRLRLELQELVSKLCTEHQKTVVFITHDVDEAILLADRIVVMEPGKIRSIHKVKFDHPRIREELSGTEEYEKLHRQLILAFYDRVGEQIDAGVAL